MLMVVTLDIIYLRLHLFHYILMLVTVKYLN